jgi:hypothetical protein
MTPSLNKSSPRNGETGACYEQVIRSLSTTNSTSNATEVSASLQSACTDNTITPVVCKRYRQTFRLHVTATPNPNGGPATLRWHTLPTISAVKGVM